MGQVMRRGPGRSGGLCRRLIALGLALGGSTGFAGPVPPGYAIATAHPLATEAGVEILHAGGNAFDAAVAIASTLAVVEPSGSGLGGGGFFLLHEAQTGRKIMVDARETAPLAATPDMFLDDQGAVVQERLRAHPLAAGIPGIPAALEHLAKGYGVLGLESALAPALRHAREGFVVDAKLARYIDNRAADLLLYPASAAVFLPEGQALEAGSRLRQPDLATTLERISVFGAAGFYQGRVADDLIRAVRAAGGIWSAKDLTAYAVKERMPVILDFMDWQIVSAPPPSSGGIVLGIMFNILSGYDWNALHRTDQLHLSIEAMRRAYFDRARFIGDTDFVSVPSRGLLSRAYAQVWREGIAPKRASVSAEFPASGASAGEGRDTTHFSVIDTQGNRVAATLSINYMLGSGFVAAGTGVLLNNEMDDFVAKPGVANAYGLVGGQANAIEPGKRMLSSMSPTFLEGRDRIAVLGTPGGSRIISMVYHAIQAVIAGKTAAEVVAQPRYHHQYLPDEVQFEPGALSPGEQKLLTRRGHVLKDLGYRFGNFQTVIWDLGEHRLDAAADPRGVGSAVVGQLPVPATPALPADRVPELRLSAP